MKPSPRTCCCAGGCPMLDMAAFRAEENKSALIAPAQRNLLGRPGCPKPSGAPSLTTQPPAGKGRPYWHCLTVHFIYHSVTVLHCRQPDEC